MSENAVADKDSKQSTKVSMVILAAGIGTFLDYFDFDLSSLAAVLIWPAVFFSTIHTPAVALMLSISAWVLGFAVRPIGGIIFGHLGDRIGRRTTLVITLLTMGIGTLGIGLDPSTETIGVTAIVLLLIFRTFQGVGIGGEWGGASSWVLEAANKSRHRIFLSSFVAVSDFVGGVANTAVFLGLILVLPHTALLAWGWRIAYYVGFAVAIAGIVIRTRVAESGFFTFFQQKKGVLRSPIVTVFKKHWRALFLAGGIGLISQVANYVMIFTVGYSETLFHTEFSIVMWGLLFGVITAMFASLLGGYLAQTIGTKITIIISGALAAAWVFPEFLLVNSQIPAAIWVSFIGAGLFCNISMGAIVSYFAAMFPTSVRYSGVGMSYQIATLVGSGLGSELAAFFLVIYGHSAWIAIGTMTVIYMIIAIIAALISKDNTHKDLATIGETSSAPSAGGK